MTAKIVARKRVVVIALFIFVVVFASLQYLQPRVVTAADVKTIPIDFDTEIVTFPAIPSSYGKLVSAEGNTMWFEDTKGTVRRVNFGAQVVETSPPTYKTWISSVDAFPRH